MRFAMSIVSYRPTITRTELENVLDCLIKDELTGGSSVRHFESALAELIQIRTGLAVCSHTAAYHLVFEALEIKPGDEVIIPSYFSSAPLGAMKIMGIKPIPVDLEEGALSPSPEAVKTLIGERTKAVIIGHTFGINASLSRFADIGVPIIEDISHALGLDFDEKPAGSEGAFAIASFTPVDMITTGNGAAVFTRNTRYFSAMKSLRQADDAITYDYAMTEFQAAMGISQLSRLQDFIRRRREIAQVYYDRLRITQHKSLFPFSPECSYHSFPVIFDASEEKVEKYWKSCGIQLTRPLIKPVHVHEGLRPMDYPISDRYAKKLYSLPIYPTLTRKEIDKISRSLAKFI